MPQGLLSTQDEFVDVCVIAVKKAIDMEMDAIIRRLRGNTRRIRKIITSV